MSGWQWHGIEEASGENLITVRDGPLHTVGKCDDPSERHRQANGVANLFPCQ